MTISWGSEESLAHSLGEPGREQLFLLEGLRKDFGGFSIMFRPLPAGSQLWHARMHLPQTCLTWAAAEL